MSRIPAGSRPVAGSSSINRRGPAQQRRGDPQPLAHPVREAAHAVAGARGQLDDLENLVDTLLRAVSVERGEQFEVLARGEVWIEARRLDEPGDALERPRALAQRIAPEQLDGALGGDDQPERHPQRRRLAGAVRSEEAVDVADVDVQVDVVDRQDLLVALDEPLRPDWRRRRRPRYRPLATASTAAGLTAPASR